MCHFCPVEIKNLGWGQGVMVGKRAFFWFCLCFYFFCFTHWQQYTGKKDKYGFCKTTYNENMRKHNCIWGPVSWYFPVQNNNKKINWIYALNWECYTFQKPSLKTFKLYKNQTLCQV